MLKEIIIKFRSSSPISTVLKKTMIEIQLTKDAKKNLGKTSSNLHCTNDSRNPATYWKEQVPLSVMNDASCFIDEKNKVLYPLNAEICINVCIPVKHDMKGITDFFVFRESLNENIIMSTVRCLQIFNYKSQMLYFANTQQLHSFHVALLIF